MLASQTVSATASDAAISGAAGAVGGAAFVTLFLIIAIYIALIALIMVGQWKTASKAGVFGLWAILPVVNLFAWAHIAGKPLWWGLLCFIPIVNIVIIVIIMFEISKRFGRGVGATIGLIFLPIIFWPILGFGSAKYEAIN